MGLRSRRKNGGWNHYTPTQHNLGVQQLYRFGYDPQESVPKLKRLLEAVGQAEVLATLLAQAISTKSFWRETLQSSQHKASY